MSFGRINLGSGILPTTFEAGGKQYVAMSTGLSRVSENKLTKTLELRDLRNQTMLFVFGL
jgi:hypothetical protein